jgi:hypothetical protein
VLALQRPAGGVSGLDAQTLLDPLKDFLVLRGQKLLVALSGLTRLGRRTASCLRTS